MRRNDITPKLLKELYCKKLLSKKEIALYLKCNPTTIHKKMRKFNILARKQRIAVRIAMQKKIIKIPKSKLENLYSKKKISISGIAEKLGYCRETIGKELRKHKIPLRSCSETMKLIRNRNKIKKSLLMKLYWKKKLTPEQIGKKLNKHPETIRRLMRGYGLKRRSKNEISMRYPKYYFSDNLKEKAYLLGFRVGDLNVQLSRSKNLIIVRCTSTKMAQIRLFKNLFKKYGYVYVGKPKKDGNKDLLIRLNRTFSFLLPKKDNIPKWVRENTNYFLSFLAGYTDAEGHIGINRKNVAHFILSSYDKKILKQTHQQLLRMGIKTHPPRIHIKKGYKKSNGCVYRNDEWSFSTNKKSSLLPLLQLLESRLKHQKRLKDLKKAKQNIIKRNQKALSKKSFS